MFWAVFLPKTCIVVIPTKLEFSAHVGFIHKESGMMHSHMIVKKQLFRSFFKEKLMWCINGITLKLMQLLFELSCHMWVVLYLTTRQEVPL